jgi:DNA-binding MarR family transcriptional regulator
MTTTLIEAASKRQASNDKQATTRRRGSMPAARMKDQLAYLIASLNRQLENELEERLRPGGVPIEQFRILDVLNASEPAAMGEIASQSLIEPPTLTKIIDRMIADGLVYRGPDPNDRRRVLIMTAAGGKTLFKRLRGVSSAQEQRIVEVLESKGAADLRTLLRELIQ